MLRFVNLVVRDAPLECPFHSVKRIGWDMLASSIAGLGAAALNWDATTDVNNTNRAIAKENVNLQRETNEQNKQIADEANALNYKMFQEQNEWNLAQWQRQNEYNSPEHMVELYKRAGLNPALLAGQVTPAGSLTSAQAKDAQKSYNTAPQVNYNPLVPDFSGFGASISSAVNAYYQNRLLDSQRKKTDIESSGQGIINERYLKFMPYELRNLINQAKQTGILGDIARDELAYRKATLSNRISMAYGDSAIQQKSMKMMDEQLTSQMLDNQLKRIMNAFTPQWNVLQLKQANMSLQQVRANIGLIMANTTLTREQAASEIEKKVGMIIDNGMKSVDLKTKQELKKTIIDSAQADLNSKLLQNEVQRYRNRDYHFDKFIDRATSVLPFKSKIGL